MKYPLLFAALVFASGCSSSTSDPDDDGDNDQVATDTDDVAGGDGDADSGDSGGDDAGDSSPTACTPGAFRCTGSSRIERCESNFTWRDVGQCTTACVNEVCTGECTPGSTQCCAVDSTGMHCGINDIQQCTNGTACPDKGAVFVRRCNSLGTWVADGECDNCLVATAVDVSYAACRVCNLPDGGGTEAMCDATQDCNGGTCHD